MIITRNMEDKDIKTEIRDYLKEEAETHIRHWMAIKRETKRLYDETEDKTKKIALKSSSLIKEDDFIFLHEITHKIQMLNVEAVKVNSRLMFIIQFATSFGMDLNFDTTYAATAKGIIEDRTSGFVFYDDKERLRYADKEIEDMFHDMSVKEVNKIGVVQSYELLMKQYNEFKELKENATGKTKADQ